MVLKSSTAERFLLPPVCSSLRLILPFLCLRITNFHYSEGVDCFLKNKVLLISAWSHHRMYQSSTVYSSPNSSAVSTI